MFLFFLCYRGGNGVHLKKDMYRIVYIFKLAKFVMKAFANDNKWVNIRNEC